MSRDNSNRKAVFHLPLAVNGGMCSAVSIGGECSFLWNKAKAIFDAVALGAGLTHNPLIMLATALSQRVAED